MWHTERQAGRVDRRRSHYMLLSIHLQWYKWSLSTHKQYQKKLQPQLWHCIVLIRWPENFSCTWVETRFERESSDLLSTCIELTEPPTLASINIYRKIFRGNAIYRHVHTKWCWLDQWQTALFKYCWHQPNVLKPTNQSKEGRSWLKTPISENPKQTTKSQLKTNPSHDQGEPKKMSQSKMAATDWNSSKQQTNKQPNQ